MTEMIVFMFITRYKKLESRDEHQAKKTYPEV